MEVTMVYQPKNPVGYRTLITWKQAGEIYCRSKDFTRSRLNKISDNRLIAHINDSARSVQRNIEEGYKRSTTKEYVAFLGFSRASLEELKGDFEELKREWREGIRWAEKGLEGVRVEGACGEGIRRENKGVEGMIRGEVIREIEGLLDLIYGEDCMMGRQITALEDKMVDDKTLPRGEAIKRVWNQVGSADRKFWNLAESKYGIIRGDKGHCRRANPFSLDGKDAL